MKSMNDAACTIKTQELVDEVRGMIDFIQTLFQEERAAHQVEVELWKRMLEPGRRIFRAYSVLFGDGDGDAGKRVRLEDGREVRRLDELHRREYQSVFGPFGLERAVHGTREGQRILYVPLDERLQLPQGKYSYLLQDRDQGLAVEVPYATVSTTVARILGFTQSVHTLERNQREMAAAVADFWQDRPTPPAQQEGALLVCTADGKGVPMRGAAETVRGAEPPLNQWDAPGQQENGP